MSRTGWITAAVLVATVVIILVALMREVAAGPTFRAEDYDSYSECISNIPTEWGPGSLQRTGAEDACGYVHRPRPGR